MQTELLDNGQTEQEDESGSKEKKSSRNLPAKRNKPRARKIDNVKMEPYDNVKMEPCDSVKMEPYDSVKMETSDGPSTSAGAGDEDAAISAVEKTEAFDAAGASMNAATAPTRRMAETEMTSRDWWMGWLCYKNIRLTVRKILLQYLRRLTLQES